jgi:hypothetical protein
MPQIHYPVFSQEVGKFVQLALKPDENLASFIKEIKDLIKIMIEDEE